MLCTGLKNDQVSQVGAILRKILHAKLSVTAQICFLIIKHFYLVEQQANSSLPVPDGRLLDL